MGLEKPGFNFNTVVTETITVDHNYWRHNDSRPLNHLLWAHNAHESQNYRHGDRNTGGQTQTDKQKDQRKTET